MRLIDADELEYEWDGTLTIDIKNAPTVDAVPVVRCGECKYYDEKDHNCFDEMAYARCWMPMDFCSFGERRKE